MVGGVDMKSMPGSEARDAGGEFIPDRCCDYEACDYGVEAWERDQMSRPVDAVCSAATELCLGGEVRIAATEVGLALRPGEVIRSEATESRSEGVNVHEATESRAGDVFIAATSDLGLGM